MNIQKIIDYIDGIKPNPYTEEDKVIWLNEVEGVIQTDVLLREPEEIVTYYYRTLWEGEGICFADDATLILPQPAEVHKGGKVTLSGLSAALGNELIDAEVVDVREKGRVLKFAPGTFSKIGITETAEAMVEFDGAETELLAEAPYQKLYYTYLMAMIDLANGDYSKYQNAMTLFNSHLVCYTRWKASAAQ
ncbi:MAG: hypothetical protein IJF43_03685 [Firmicutes bacterium]|nr:hypothetical protein [Bacillota bacterium]